MKSYMFHLLLTHFLFYFIYNIGRATTLYIVITGGITSSKFHHTHSNTWDIAIQRVK